MHRPILHHLCDGYRHTRFLGRASGPGQCCRRIHGALSSRSLEAFQGRNGVSTDREVKFTLGFWYAELSSHARSMP